MLTYSYIALWFVYSNSYRLYSSQFAYMFTNTRKYNCISQIKRYLSINVHWHAFTLTQLSNPVFFQVDSSILITWTSLFFEKRGISYTNHRLIIYLAVLKKGTLKKVTAFPHTHTHTPRTPHTHKPSSPRIDPSFLWRILLSIQCLPLIWVKLGSQGILRGSEFSQMLLGNW